GAQHRSLGTGISTLNNPIAIALYWFAVSSELKINQFFNMTLKS
ncbi:MAG: hypothetical protein ACI9ZX_003367, partial [Algoriphagus sp.]